ncbi:hypothetical protein ACIQXU_16685 [Peribacillus sp. NPDC097284]|uniref:hypothetical protein n=1 Tax=Peribacillus sp. NPDC097284 TaxID=3364401 RepID=UPI00381C632D
MVNFVRMKDYYSNYIDSINQFIGLEIDIVYLADKDDIDIVFKSLTKEILETNQKKFNNLSQKIKSVLLDFYERFENLPYQATYKQIFVEELAYSLIDKNHNSLINFIETLKELCIKTYELEDTKMGFIIVREDNINVQKVLEKLNISYTPYKQSLQYFITEKQALKLIDSQSVCLVLNKKYQVIGVARKKKEQSSIKNIMMNRFRVFEESEIKYSSHDYYLGSQIKFKKTEFSSEEQSIRSAIEEIIHKVASEYKIDLDKGTIDLEDVLDKIDVEKLDEEEIVKIREYMDLHTSLQYKLIKNLNATANHYETHNTFLSGIVKQLKQGHRNHIGDLHFVYFEKKQIFWSASYENLIIYSNGRWKLRNYFLLSNIISHFVMRQTEIQKYEEDFNLNYTLEEINNLIPKILDLYDSIKSLSNKNIGSLICILNEKNITNDELYFRMLLTKKLTFDKFNVLIKNEDATKINILDCDNFLFELICSIDGGLIIDKYLNIHSAGEMFSSENVNNKKNYRGARTLAALGASRYGLAVKISEDGDILVFENENEVARI